MANRRPIQQQHERAVVRNFLAWLNHRRHTNFSVLSEPNPPEVIIRSARLTSWVEIADVFWTDEFARDEYSYATPEETHKPIPDGVYVRPDDQFSHRFVDVLSKKLRKTSYEPFRDEHGPGYLVLCVQYPLFNGTTVRRMKKCWSLADSKQDKDCFREVYIASRSFNGQFLRWHV